MLVCPTVLLEISSPLTIRVPSPSFGSFLGVCLLIKISESIFCPVFDVMTVFLALTLFFVFVILRFFQLGAVCSDCIIDAIALFLFAAV